MPDQRSAPRVGSRPPIEVNPPNDPKATAAGPVSARTGGARAQHPHTPPDFDDPTFSVDEPDSCSSGSLLSGAAGTSATEYYSPIPPGYRKGYPKYIVVFGTVMSGLGKGIFAASVAKLLKDKGLIVAPIKLEGYLNIDAGTLNPYRHGEVFVLDDGTECDMDLGTYERMLDQDLSKKNFTTSGQVYSEILDRERRGSYLGRDVQMIPHVTGEVKRKIRELALHGDGRGRPADVVFVEVGGTVGDYENAFYIEALRELAFEEGEHSTCFVALTYVLKPETLGEQKSKPAQLGIKRLMEAGIQPDLIACRAADPVTDNAREKIAMFSNVPLRRCFSMHDRPSIYTIPDEMRESGLDREILSMLRLHERVDAAQEDRARERWSGFVRKLTAPKQRSLSLGITGKYAHLRDAYASIDKAIEHCGAHLGTDIAIKWIDTTDVSESVVDSRLKGLDCIIVPGGFGSRGVEGKIACVRHCRERKIPYLGICLGFQVAVIEFARNVLGLQDATSTEFDPKTAHPVISELPEQKKIEGLGGSMRLGAQDLTIAPGTLAQFLYGGGLPVRERFRHRYEVDPAYVARFEEAGLCFSGRHPTQPIMQVLELPTDGPSPHAHPYFVAGQFHPELTSRPLRPQPLFMGLIAAAIARKHVAEGGSLERLLAEESVRRWIRTPGTLGASVGVPTGSGA
ncbi:MAG: CTP synthase [Phycisphaerales bacterium]